MANNINFFDTMYLRAIVEEIVPPTTFFRDRYFPTGAGDIFASRKVLTEYRNGDRQMAAFVSERAGDIPVARRGYAVHEYEPAYIAPSRLLTLDDLRQRGFGEAMYSNVTEQQRAAMLLRDDLADLERRIGRREEWMAVQTMINNACEIQTMVDDDTKGEKLYVQFYDTESDHTYTIGNAWDGDSADIFGDVKAMCRMLSRRGLPAADLILGTDVADVFLANSEVRELLNKTSGIIVGQIEADLMPYDGVALLGVINFGGFRLNVISVDEGYSDGDNIVSYFPAKSVMVSAPGAGHMMYGAVTQIDYGNVDFTTYAAARVPKFAVDQDKDIRKLRLAAKPLAAPGNYCPWIYAANAIS